MGTPKSAAAVTYQALEILAPGEPGLFFLFFLLGHDEDSVWLLVVALRVLVASGSSANAEGARKHSLALSLVSMTERPKDRVLDLPHLCDFNPSILFIGP